jgi:hypothetical protein
MGWLKKLLGRPDAPGHGLDPTRPPPQKSPAGQPHHPDPPEQPVNPSWTATAPTLRPEGHLRVVGESYRQDAMRRVLAGVGPYRLVMAQLVRDRTNPHHGGAVAVLWGRITLATSAGATLAMKANPSTGLSLGWLNAAHPLRAGRG